ncbi:hypothetical protein [Actinoplanes sp. N902-109]|uniref:hypothetical protein n=1 Tax=Actinoplanes sp. (strain N902-109) TaxID=649831 RepID=UPI0003294B46|nr:hypothetical protein [Actinoplanes sp. N902-109]AGL21506.1 hypothetical protein L083_7996 [Actinoplanes sp. N902-109]
MSGTAEVVAFYAQSWINRDTGAARRVIAPDAGIAWNLGQPVDDEELLDVLGRVAAFVDAVTIVSVTCTGERAALLHDCAGPFGTVRLAEFLEVTDGRISDIRQLWDVTAVRRYFPGLLDG